MVIPIIPIILVQFDIGSSGFYYIKVYIKDNSSCQKKCSLTLFGQRAQYIYKQNQTSSLNDKFFHNGWNMKFSIFSNSLNFSIPFVSPLHVSYRHKSLEDRIHAT